MSENEGIYGKKRYFALALDPIHIGTGGYRIGRVDNTIVREPSTNIPKIPGTTIEGVCRSYAYLRAKEDGLSIQPECAKGKTKDNKEPCGNCTICITLGFTTKNKSLQAMALFSDARILFFPVATMIGPVWVTCPMVLSDAGIENTNEPEENKFITSLDTPENKLNFGWLLLERDSTKSINGEIWNLPINSNILERVVIVPDSLFSQIVNSNLEVRTSVAIDPERRAAEERALFTYEAIPRGTVFWFDVVYQDPKNFGLTDWNTGIIMKAVEDGLSLFQHLGVGGMGSRGFGRLDVTGRFLSYDEYLNGLEKRMEQLKKGGKTNELSSICNYLKITKSKIETDANKFRELIGRIDELLSKFESGGSK